MVEPGNTTLEGVSVATDISKYVLNNPSLDTCNILKYDTSQLSTEYWEMDEVFWSSVVKRWSDASESVIKLKKELATLQEEVLLWISLSLFCLVSNT